MSPPSQVSEKIVDLNTQYHELLSKNVVLEARIEEMANDKDNLLSIQDELRQELQDKMALLDEFEAKFDRQFRCGAPWLRLWQGRKAGEHRVCHFEYVTASLVPAGAGRRRRPP